MVATLFLVMVEKKEFPLVVFRDDGKSELLGYCQLLRARVVEVMPKSPKETPFRRPSCLQGEGESRWSFPRAKRRKANEAG